jgi:hypothetical protein
MLVKYGRGSGLSILAALLLSNAGEAAILVLAGSLREEHSTIMTFEPASVIA